MVGAASELLAGVRLLPRGLGLVLRRPRLFWLGAVPPLVTSVIFTAVLVVLVLELPALTDFLTPFADRWPVTPATIARIVVGAGVLGGAALLMVISFTTLTLALGSPIYDKISEHVDLEIEPELRAPAESPLTSVGRSVRHSLTLIAISAVVAPLLFLAGLVPLVGQTVVPVLSATFGGWMLCLELVGSPFERRGVLHLRERRTAMRRRRLRVLGFAVPTFLLMAIPFAGVVVFPMATAGATLLARELLGSTGAAPAPVNAPTPRS